MCPQGSPLAHLPVCSQVRDCHVSQPHEEQHSEPSSLPLNYVGPRVGAPVQMGKKGQILLGLLLLVSPQVTRCTVPRLTMGPGSSCWRQEGNLLRPLRSHTLAIVPSGAGLAKQLFRSSRICVCSGSNNSSASLCSL